MPRSTPLKRLRSPESRMQTDSLLSPTRDRMEDGALDNIRSHKRFLSEAGFTDYSLHIPAVTRTLMHPMLLSRPLGSIRMQQLRWHYCCDTS